MPNMISYGGPHIIQGDVNNDKLDDLFICGAKDQPGTLFLQQKNGTYLEDNQHAFKKMHLQRIAMHYFLMQTTMVISIFM